MFVHWCLQDLRKICVFGYGGATDRPHWPSAVTSAACRRNHLLSTSWCRWPIVATSGCQRLESRWVAVTAQTVATCSHPELLQVDCTGRARRIIRPRRDPTAQRPGFSMSPARVDDEERITVWGELWCWDWDEWVYWMGMRWDAATLWLQRHSVPSHSHSVYPLVSIPASQLAPRQNKNVRADTVSGKMDHYTR